MQYICYTMRQGDTIQAVAAAYNVSTDAILAANPQIITQAVFCPGEMIAVPQQPAIQPPYCVPAPVNPGGILPVAPLPGVVNPGVELPATSLPGVVTPGVELPVAPLPGGVNPCVNQPSPLPEPVVPNPLPEPIPMPTPNPLPEPTPWPTPEPNPGDTTLEDEVVELVNSERARRGLAALTLNRSLGDVARAKADDMAANNYFSHTSPTYGTPFEMLQRFGFTYSSAGENIAMGQATAQSVMNSWMSSSGHAANILNSAYTEIGVGYAYNNGAPIWTQLFLRP